MKAQGTVARTPVPRFNPERIRFHPGNNPVFEFCRRRNSVRGDGNLESRRLIKPSLVLSRYLVQPLADLLGGQERESIRWDGILTAEVQDIVNVTFTEHLQQYIEREVSQ